MNFEQMASAIIGYDDPETLRVLIDALRHVWNARGAADCAALEAEIWTRRDVDTLRKLDR